MSGTDNKKTSSASQSLEAEKYGTPAVLAMWVTEDVPLVGWAVSNVASLVAPEHHRTYASLSRDMREMTEQARSSAPRPSRN